jgi:hypothetical protein
MITVTELRKTFTSQGIKGAGKWKREDFTSTIIAAEFAAYAEAETRKPVAEPKKGTCEDCGRKVGKSGHPTLCTPCWDYAGWENTHSDAGHATFIESGEAVTRDLAVEIAECPVCHPELDPRKPVAKREGRSRAGMVIVAKGSEIHKSQVFRAAAEAAGWTVTVLGDDETGRYYADAHRGAEAIQLAWEGRAYDYSASSARINGKDRKVRNLKEALRLL